MKIIIGTMILSVFGTVSFSGISDSTRVDNPQMTVKCDVNGAYILSYSGIKEPLILRLLNLPCRGLSDKQAKGDSIEPINLTYISYDDYALAVENKPGITSENPDHIWDEVQLLSKVRYDQVAAQIEFIATEIYGKLQMHIYDDRDQLLYHNYAVAGNVDQIFDFGEAETNWVYFVLSSGGHDISSRKFHLREKVNF